MTTKQPNILKAWKHFASVFPTQTATHADLILESIRIIETLEGACHSNRCTVEDLKFGDCNKLIDEHGVTKIRSTPPELWDSMQSMFRSRHCVSMMLLNYFGISMKTYPTFDPVVLRDAANCDPKVRAVLGLSA